MRYQKILLVNPAYSGARVKAVFSAGLGYIAEALKSYGYNYDVFDLSLGYTQKSLMGKIKSFCPDLIGVSMMTYRYKETCGLIKNIKQRFPAVLIAAGGPHVSLFREELLRGCPELDYGITMEGEETSIELCKGIPLESIKGLIMRNAQGVVYNGDRRFIQDLDAVAFPRYEKFELDKIINRQINALPIVSSRGCPFECVYCPVKCSIGKVFRMRSPGNIAQELGYWYNKGYRRFSFADDNFTLVKQRVVDLCEMIKSSGLKGLALSCDNGVRADKVDEELLALMKEAGFYRIAFGVEAGSDRILKNLNKSESIETIKQRIQEACGLGYEIDLFFLVGSPGETLEDLEDSFKIASDYPIGTAYFYNIIPFPHTRLFDWIKENGKFLKQPQDYLNDYPILDNDPVFETPEMPVKEKKEALRRAFAITRKTMRRNWAKRLAKIGALGGLLAFIYTTEFVQNIVIRNRSLRKMINTLARFCLK